MNGSLVRGDANARFEGAVLDSRAVKPGQLFFALEGAATDGHRFVSSAFMSGAAGAVVSRIPDEFAAAEGDGGSGSGRTLIQVDDTYQALHALVRTVRESTPQHLVAITGSAGKTTTKELLTAMLSRKFAAAPSPGNLNNLFGFPLALLSIPNDTEWMVAEMGMSTPGELGGVSRLGRPEIGIFTNVRHAHVEGFERAGDLGDRSGEEVIRDAKAELLEGLDPNGLVIVNAEDPNTVEIGHLFLSGQRSFSGKGSLARESSGRALGFALDRASADTSFEIPLSVEELETSATGHRLRVSVVASGESEEVFLPLHGAVNVENFLAAATCAHVLGVELAQISAAMQGAQLPAGRGAVQHIGGALVIDDSYNSNPSALERALRAAAALQETNQRKAALNEDGPEVGRLWAVLGEMRELGSRESELHRAAGELAGALGYHRVVGVGEMAREILAGASDAGSKVQWFEDATAATAVARRLRPNDVVLVKGSRSVGLERVVAALREVRPSSADQPVPGTSSADGSAPNGEAGSN